MFSQIALFLKSYRLTFFSKKINISNELYDEVNVLGLIIQSCIKKLRKKVL